MTLMAYIVAMSGAPATSSIGYRTYRTRPRDREPLIQYMLDALTMHGCRILHRSPPGEAPFRITYETPGGWRGGIIAYAFLANARRTRNRPADEHRFQLKYGADDKQPHEIWQDPSGLHTTLLVGINPDLGIFVGADPVLHSPTRMFISIEFKKEHVEAIRRAGWHVWERSRRLCQSKSA